MGKSIPGGREVYQNALSYAGLSAREVDDYDDIEDEPDTVGERTYDDNVAQVAD